MMIKVKTFSLLVKKMFKNKIQIKKIYEKQGYENRYAKDLFIGLVKYKINPPYLVN